MRGITVEKSLSHENEPKIDKQKTCVKIMMIRKLKKIKKRPEKGEALGKWNQKAKST
jgi:hypothetical protein